jgi:maleylpyruvate isomerase
LSLAEIIAAVDARTRRIVDALAAFDERGLLAPSLLPDWNRLTIACHLRYGAQAFLRMTHGALDAEPVSYYPTGREAQRPSTLVPEPGERPDAVVGSLSVTSTKLHAVWSTLDDALWDLPVVEPEGTTDLGTLTLSRLPLLRLTEVEVHGSDLDVGLDDWSGTFVRTALPFRLDWLNARRTNHRAIDASIEGSWLLRATDGPTYLVTVEGDRVESRPAEADATTRAVIEASSRDLLALLLGRSLRTAPTISGDADFAAALTRAFPGP